MSDRPTDDDPRPAGPARSSRLVLAALAGGLAALVSVLVVAVLLLRQPLPPIGPAELEAAWQRWQAAAPHSYAVTVAVSGTQPATYRVLVRQGQVQSATRNAQPLKDERTLGTWSVPGMFRTIRSDVERVEQARQADDAAGAGLSLRADFDPRYGYPRRYHRVEWGSSVEVFWQVTEFRVLD